MNSTKSTVLFVFAGVAAVLGVCCILFAMSFHNDQAADQALLEANGIQVGVFRSVDDWGLRHTEIIGVHLYPDSLGVVNSDGRVPICKTHLMEVIQRCPDIFDCTLSNSDVDSQAILNLESLRELTSLRLSNTQVDDQLCRELAKSNQLSLLDVRETAVTDQGLALLASSSVLDKLIVGGDRSGITGEFLHAFADNETLRWVIIFGDDTDPIFLDQIHLTEIKRIALVCKPSELPISSILKSNLERIKVGWAAPLDDADKEVLEALENAVPRISVLFSDPDVL